MSQTLEGVERQLSSARDLQSVVRTMKALAAVSIVPYERAARALSEYFRTVELGLLAAVREGAMAPGGGERETTGPRGAVVFGSDQGMVGQFNDHLAANVVEGLGDEARGAVLWPVGERIHARLEDQGLSPRPSRRVPDSVAGVGPLVGDLLVEIEAARSAGDVAEVWIFHNRSRSAASYEPVSQRLLPLDARWLEEIGRRPWPTRALPEVIQGPRGLAASLVREYLFVSLFRACAESLAGENAARLASMQGAEKNIDELLARLQLRYHQQRQTAITEELFDVIAGAEALRGGR